MGLLLPQPDGPNHLVTDGDGFAAVSLRRSRAGLGNLYLPPLRLQHGGHVTGREKQSGSIGPAGSGSNIRRRVPHNEQRATSGDRGSKAGEQGITVLLRQVHELGSDKAKGGSGGASTPGGRGVPTRWVPPAAGLPHDPRPVAGQRVKNPRQSPASPAGPTTLSPRPHRSQCRGRSLAPTRQGNPATTLRQQAADLVCRSKRPRRCRNVRPKNSRQKRSPWVQAIPAFVCCVALR